MKKYKNIILTVVLVIFLLNIDLVIKSVNDSCILFFNKIFVSVFPFIILSDILLYYDYHLFLEKIFGKTLSKLFNVKKSTSIIFILSLLTCAPNNAIYIKDMLERNEIDINEAEIILTYTSFSSISFVIGTIGVYLYKSIIIGLILWLIILLNNILIGISLRNKKTISNSNAITNNKQISNIFLLLKESTIKGINTSFIILGNLIVFSIMINLFLKYIHLNNIISSIIIGFIEMTNGIIMTSNLNISLLSKIFITSFILTFSSMSVLFQSFSILSNYKINIKKILIKLVFSLFYLLMSIIFLI